MEKEAIPSIDFSAFLVDEGCMIGDPPTPAQLETAASIDRVCQRHGFLYLNNFGISAEEARQAFEKSKEMFSMKEADKARLKKYDPATNTGFSGYATEALNKVRPPDMKEAFNVRSRIHYENDFSGAPEGFQEVAEGLWGRLEEAARRLCVACAVALGLPREDMDFFAKTCTRMDLSTLRFLHCPPCDFQHDTNVDSAAVALRLGEHTDFGMLTLLFHDSAANGEGLQVKQVEGGAVGGEAGGERGGWLDVCGRGGSTAIVNTGAMLARWTNDRWKATAHRVVVPSAEAAKGHRFSIAFFLDPDKHQLIEAHPACIPRGAAPKYAAISSEDFLQLQLRERMVATDPVA